MNFASVDWVGLLVNWFPMLLIMAVWVFFLRLQTKGGGFAEQRRRQTEALERIAAALEKRH